MGHLSC